jgi:hypothetical protein
MKVKMYGQKRLVKQPNNTRDLRYLKKQRERQREQITKSVAAQARKKEKAVPAYLDDRTESGLLSED